MASELLCRVDQLFEYQKGLQPQSICLLRFIHQRWAFVGRVQSAYRWLQPVFQGAAMMGGCGC